VRPNSGCFGMGSVVLATPSISETSGSRWQQNDDDGVKPSAGLPPGHEDSVQRMKSGSLGSPRKPGVHWRQWVAPSSTRLSPITPMRHGRLHFFGNRGIRLPRTTSAGRELPPYPGHYPGPWLGPLSFIARHTPVHPPCIVGRVGTSILGKPRIERRTTCPSSDGSTCAQDGFCS
jgi:hypothetical protein